MNVTLDPAQMSDLMSEALLSWLTTDKRDALIKEAMKHILTPNCAYPGAPRVSPIESAFRSAVEQVARKQAEEMLIQNPEVQDKIKQLLVDAVELLTVQERQKTVESIANAISAGLNPSRY